MKLATLPIAALMALYPLAPIQAAATAPLALFAAETAADLPALTLIRGGDDRGGHGGGRDGDSGHGGGDDRNDDRDDDDNDDDDGDRDDDDRDDDDNDASGSGRDHPRIPGGSGCDDPGDILEHPECRLP